MTSFKASAAAVAIWACLAAAVGPSRAGAEAPAEPTDQPAYSDENVDLIRQLMRQRGGDPAALAQLVQLTRTCSAAKAAELFDELAAAHRRAGDLTQAAATRQLLIERFPDEPAARHAILWLVRLYASSEMAWAHRPPTQAASAAPLVIAPGAGPAVLTSAETPANAGQGKKATENELSTFALLIAGKAAVVRPALVSDPAMAFQRSVAARRAGELKAARGFLTSLKHSRAGDPWGDCARLETWLADERDAPPPKPTVRCTATSAPPHLDGVLDEPCWQGEAARMGESQVWLAHDGEYLYMAVRRPKSAGIDYPRDDRARTHDGDVAAFDHVRLLVDVDRDYATCFELWIDSRGWTADRVWGEARWNPEWFVAAGESDAVWTAEAAIALSELSGERPSAGAAWACRIEGRRPGEARQAWPAVDDGARGPARFGVLLFE